MKNERHREPFAAVQATERYTNYDSFSWFYERYWCDEVPPAIFTVIERLLLPMLRPRSSILDLCCGTGYTTARLERMGYRMTGLDGSERMLKFAKRHAPRSRFVLADARSFELERAFDAVVSTFDSLNHLMTPEELEAAIGCAHRALAPDGLFLFDMMMESGFLNHWTDYFSIVEEDEACLLRGHYDREERIGRYDITMFRRRGDAWQRSDALIMERCYSMKEIRGALRRTGFEMLSVFDAERDLGLTDHTGRKFFLARAATGKD